MNLYSASYVSQFTAEIVG